MDGLIIKTQDSDQPLANDKEFKLPQPQHCNFRSGGRVGRWVALKTSECCISAFSIFMLSTVLLLVVKLPLVDTEDATGQIDERA
ncbi:hypothetical protein BJX70DRAFT_375493 [Aspergillus crustosus]